MKSLSKQLRHLLQQAHLSESELARLCGIPQQVINRLLNDKNKNPTINTLSAIADYFSITISQLLGEEELPAKLTLAKSSNKKMQKVPLLEFKDLPFDPTHCAKKTILLDTAPSKTIFALLNSDDSMEPKFSMHSTLVFDTSPPPKHGDYVLVFNKKKKTILFRQLWIQQSIAYIKCLHLKYDDAHLTKLDEQSNVIAVLIQSQTHFS